MLLIVAMLMEWAMAGQVNMPMESKPYLKNIQDLTTILGDFLTSRGENVLPVCVTSGEYYKHQLAEQSSPWAAQMFDSDPKFPHSGLLEGYIIHYPGVFESRCWTVVLREILLDGDLPDCR